MKQNILIMQSGGCTPVLNRSLYGIISEALAQPDHIGEIYGAHYGMEGIIARDIIDLRRTPSDEWRRIARTPGAVLGSTRRKLRDEDVQPILDTLRKHNITCWFIIGGNDSATTGHDIGLAAEAQGMSLSVINVPKTIDNDLILTDHSPGYGSAARFVALATMGAGWDAEAMGIAAPITIIEVMGRDADGSPPHPPSPGATSVTLHTSSEFLRFRLTRRAFSIALRTLTANMASRSPSSPRTSAHHKASPSVSKASRTIRTTSAILTTTGPLVISPRK